MTANPDSLDPLTPILGHLNHSRGHWWCNVQVAHLRAVVDEVKMLRSEILNLESDLEELESELDVDGAPCCRAQVTAGGGEHEPDCGAA